MQPPHRDDTRKSQAIRRDPPSSPQALEETQESPTIQRPPANLLARILQSPLMVLLLLGLLLGGVMLLAVAGGYQAGVAERHQTALEARQAELDAQYMLATGDVEAGRYQRAIQRLNYILEIDADFPDAARLRSEAEQAYNQANQVTPTLALPTPTPRPTAAPAEGTTPEEMLAELEAAQAAEDWEAMVGLAIGLRAAHPDYQRIRIDGLLFRGLRNLGVEHIQASPDQLELGMFYLDEAAKIGVLDGEAEQHALWAYFYLSGKSYAGLNWSKAVDAFTTVYTIAPYFHDTRAQLVRAHIGYGDLLAAGGAPCDAQLEYQAALELALGDTAAEEKRATAEQACLTGEVEGTPDPNATPSSDSPDATPEP